MHGIYARRMLDMGDATIWDLCDKSMATGYHINGLVHDCSNSIANALELL